MRANLALTMLNSKYDFAFNNYELLKHRLSSILVRLVLSKHLRIEYLLGGEGRLVEP